MRVVLFAFMATGCAAARDFWAYQSSPLTACEKACIRWRLDAVAKPIGNGDTATCYAPLSLQELGDYGHVNPLETRRTMVTVVCE